MALQGLWLGVAGSGGASALVPSYQWKFLSAKEKDAVDKSIAFIRSHRIQNVSLNIMDDAGHPYTGPLSITQDSTSFIFWVGDPDWPQAGKWKEYLAMTPSRTYYMYGASWKYVEPSKYVFGLSDADYDYSKGLLHGIVDFHVLMGPDMGGPFPETPPDWAMHSDYETYKTHLMKYVEFLVTHLKGKVHYYLLWDEANVWYGNGNWPIERIIEIIKLEAVTIRSIDPEAKIVTALTEISPERLRDFEKTAEGHNWTTEDFVRRLVAADVPFDIIGIDSYYGCQPWPSRAGDLYTLYNRLATLGEFRKPLYVWESGPVSYIAPHYLTEGLQYLWHGAPTEEKQAEYILAETLILLGNPLMTGVRFNILYDRPVLTDSYHSYQGLIHTNGTQKRAFSALQELWNNLTVNNVTLQSDNGAAVFRGLAGNYTLNVEGYRSVKFEVSNGKSNLTLSLTSLNPTTMTTEVTSTSLASTSQASQGPALSLAGNMVLGILLGVVVVIALALATRRFLVRRSGALSR